MEEKITSQTTIKTLRIPEDLHTQLKIKATEEHITLYELTISILKKAIEE